MAVDAFGQCKVRIYIFDLTDVNGVKIIGRECREEKDVKDGCFVHGEEDSNARSHHKLFIIMLNLK